MILLFIVLNCYPLGHVANAGELTPKLVLVTLDGVRWQEVFGGIDESLVNHKQFTHSAAELEKSFGHELRVNRRALLFPFLWSIIAKQGILIGDRTEKSYMNVSNPWWFSYPGYNEILTGRADPAIDSNNKNWNNNITLLEALNNTASFNGQVAAFSSWDVFPYIINTQRNHLPVNAGFDLAQNPTSDKARWLNQLSSQSPKLWQSVRLDYLTHGYAMENFNSQQPKVTYIAYGETDDFAHDGNYDRYIDAAHRTDAMLAELWQWLQADRRYQNQTTLIITTDHGRGNTPEGWAHHFSQAAASKMNLLAQAPEGVLGSNHIWFAAIGPKIPAKGLLAGTWQQSQVAATALSSLNQNPIKLMPKANSIMAGVLQ